MNAYPSRALHLREGVTNLLIKGEGSAGRWDTIRRYSAEASQMRE